MEKQDNKGGGCGLWAVVLREVRRIGARRLYLCLGLALPLLIFSLFAALFYRGIVTDMPVAVLDQDHSALSRALIRMVDATQTVTISHRVMDVEQGKQALSRGEVYALLVLPADMERDVFRGRGATPTLYYNNQLLLVGGNVQRAVGKAVGTLSAGIDVTRRMKTGDSRTAAMVHMEPLAVDLRILFNPHLNYTHYLFLSCLPSMLMIFCCSLTTYALASEVKAGSCGQWLATANGSAVTAIAGKLFPHTLMIWISAMVMLLLSFKTMAVPFWGDGGLVLGITLLFVLACQMICVLILAWVKQMDGALTLSSFYSGSAFAFAGVTFPTMSMPPLAQWYSNLLPLSHYVRLLQAQTLGGVTPLHAMPGIKILLAFVLVPGILGLILTRIPGGIFHGKGGNYV